jgi:hypothetical protein
MKKEWTRMMKIRFREANSLSSVFIRAQSVFIRVRLSGMEAAYRT